MSHPMDLSFPLRRMTTLHMELVSNTQTVSRKWHLKSKQNENSKMRFLTWHISLVFLASICLFAEFSIKTSAQEAQRPWYENLPAVAMDYKVHLDAGKEDCYYQYVQPGATFYVSFSVVRGGDGMAGFAVKNPSGAIVRPYQWLPTADYTEQTSPGGYYAICIDNQFSRFAGKLVNIYITVVKYDAWDKYAKEIEALQLNIQNFTSTIGTVERNINDMLSYQSFSRNREARDYALLLDNNKYVTTFSVSQILVILITCSVQVYFVKKLFDIKSGSSRSRI